MRAARWQEPATASLAALVFAACALAPLLVLAADIARVGSLATLFTTGAVKLLLGSLATAAAVTVLAVVAGVPLGFALARTDVAGRGVALALHAFPLFLPPFLVALGAFHLLGSAVFSPVFAVVVLALALTPVVTLLVTFALDGIDPSLEDAARIAAPTGRVARAILLPLVLPSVALGAMVVFALAFSELGVPMFLRVPAYSAAVFARLGGFDAAPGEAFVLTLPLLGTGLLLVALERRLARRSRVTLGLRRDRPALALGRWRVPATLGCFAAALAGVAPLVALALGADVAGALAWVGSSLTQSLLVAASTATACLALAAVLAHAGLRRRGAARAADIVAFLAFLTPAGALGAALIDLWNRPAAPPLYGTMAIVVVGLVARYTLLALRPMSLALATAPPDLEDAARVAGASYARRLARIVLPQHGRALVATWILVAVFALRDVELAILFYPPGGETLTVRIFTLEANGPPGAVAGLAVLQVLVTGALLGAGLLALRRRR